ncbi:hypothetical protein F5B20DRAFT_269056 [Whalleya microplaca]|nr:hypothetical protein F5B20DRAFT_269056 [Whalleya microplaca]
MSLPSTNATGQSSILNFFQPKQPSYAPPPSASQTTQQTKPLPTPPPPPPQSQPAAAAATTNPSSPAPPPPSAEPGAAAVAAPQPPTRPAGLHPQASISPILPEHVKPLRSIIGVLLQVQYGDQFFAKLFDPRSSGAFSRVLLWSEPNEPAKVIGGLVCRPEATFPSNPNDDTHTHLNHSNNDLYIQTLVLLSPYQKLGLAATLLDEVMRAAAAPQATALGLACASVYAHVWTRNPEGLRWYLARGFARTDEVLGYYRQLQPDSAWIVRRPIHHHGVSAALGLPTPPIPVTTSTTTTTISAGSPNGQPRAIIPPSVTAAAANLPPPPPLNTTTATTTTTQGTAPATRPPLRSPGLSFQTQRPETEWNDLPADMHSPRPPTQLGVPPDGSGASSAASSRSSSAARKKKDRAYPAAAFGAGGR